MITRKHLPRRAFLRGLGAAVALPMLDAMTPAMAAVKNSAAGTAPVRVAFAYVPNGVTMASWTPEAAGADFAFSRILKPLEAYRSDMLLLSGLTHNNGRALGDGAGDHARAAASYLTGVHPRKTAGADIQNGPSVDQVAAQAIGKHTRFASLELGCEDGRIVGSCDSGYSCAYSNSISWRTATTPNPVETNPRLVFERLFGGYDPSETAETRARREKYHKSILDYVLDDAKRLQGNLGSTDRRKLDEYLYAVREVERRIETAEKGNITLSPDVEKPMGVPAEFSEHSRLMYDLLLLAFQTDSTRVATLMVGREGSNRSYREIGVPESHHGLSHHRNDPEMVEKITKINEYHVQQFAYFIKRLKESKEGDGSLLDRTMVVYGSGLSDGNRHQHNDLPVLVMGGSKAGFKTGRHIRYEKETPMTNMYLSLLGRVGVETSKLGDSNGQLGYLSEM